MLMLRVHLVDQVSVDAVGKLLDERVDDEFEMRPGAGFLVLLFFTNTNSISVLIRKRVLYTHAVAAAAKLPTLLVEEFLGQLFVLGLVGGFELQRVVCDIQSLELQLQLVRAARVFPIAALFRFCKNPNKRLRVIVSVPSAID